MRRAIRRLPRTFALAIIIAIGIFNVYHAVVGWTLSDAGAYWNAAMRLREGAELYPALASVDASDVYRYAPWFAWLTVPVTYLPQQLAGALWSVALLGASAIALIPLIRMRAWLLVALFGPILVGISAVGNVHALVIATLVWGVERRGGPFWIAVAASLKILPLLLALVYAGRGQWGRFGVAVLHHGPALGTRLPLQPGQLRGPGRPGGIPLRNTNPLLCRRGGRRWRDADACAHALGMVGGRDDRGARPAASLRL